MDENTLQEVYTLTDATRAEVIAMALRSEGIPCELENEHQAGFTGILKIRLFVREQDVDRATKLIRSHEEPKGKSNE